MFIISGSSTLCC